MEYCRSGLGRRCKHAAQGGHQGSLVEPPPSLDLSKNRSLLGSQHLRARESRRSGAQLIQRGKRCCAIPEGPESHGWIRVEDKQSHFCSGLSEQLKQL